jgi:hypothetical protein
MTADSALNESDWTSSFIANLTNDWTALINAVNTNDLPSGGGMTFGAVSFTDGGVPRGTPLFEATVANATQTRICTQRRRLGKSLPG